MFISTILKIIETFVVEVMYMASNAYEVRNQVITHFNYHNMHELCSIHKISEACIELRKRNIIPDFTTICAYLKGEI